jgi:predicted ATP-grasp superfamily ATP-dependent carboligase
VKGTTAFVTDGDERSALAVVRSLGRRGVSVIVGEERPMSLASSSRYAARHVTYPSPSRERDAFGRFLVEFVTRENVDAVIPITDVTTHAVSQHQLEIERYAATAVPPFEAFELATNKWTLVQRATACGVRAPRTHFVADLMALDGLVDEVEYPAVVKPVRSRLPVNGRWVATTVHYAAAKDDLVRLYERTPYLAAHPSLIQERIVGPGMGVFAIFDRGVLLAAFAHRRLREKPPSGGVSVLRESVPLDPALAEAAARLLGPLNWHGVAMLEFKRECRTGDQYLMEVNGRFWGSLQLAIDAGVDFPWMVHQLARGLTPEVPGSYAVGVKCRWFLGDVDHLLLRIFRRDRDLNLPPCTASRFRALREFVRFSEPGLHYEVLRREDPRPGVFEAREYMRALLSIARRRLLPI